MKSWECLRYQQRPRLKVNSEARHAFASDPDSSKPMGVQATSKVPRKAFSDENLASEVPCN